LQTRPRRLPKRARAARQPPVERPDAPPEREDLGSRELEPRSRYTCHRCRAWHDPIFARLGRSSTRGSDDARVERRRSLRRSTETAVGSPTGDPTAQPPSVHRSHYSPSMYDPPPCRDALPPPPPPRRTPLHPPA